MIRENSSALGPKCLQIMLFLSGLVRKAKETRKIYTRNNSDT